MREPRESTGVDFRLDACLCQRRQRGAGRQIASSVVRIGRLAGGDRIDGQFRQAAGAACPPNRGSAAPTARSLPLSTRLNGVMSQQFAGIATSPVPVLVPFDVDALLHDQAAGRTPAI